MRSSGRIGKLKYTAQLFVLVVALTSGACIFSAREPEQPATGGTGSTVVLDAPQKPFSAISATFDQLNSANYERAISSAFIFSPLLDDSLDQQFIGTDVYVDWTKDVEMEVLEAILADASAINVTFIPTQLIDQTTFVRWSVDYELTIVAAVTGDTTRYGGNSQIDTRNEAGSWRITYWKDISAADPLRTWGYLRGITRERLGI